MMFETCWHVTFVTHEDPERFLAKEKGSCVATQREAVMLLLNYEETFPHEITWVNTTTEETCENRTGFFTHPGTGRRLVAAYMREVEVPEALQT